MTNTHAKGVTSASGPSQALVDTVSLVVALIRKTTKDFTTNITATSQFSSDLWLGSAAVAALLTEVERMLNIEFSAAQRTSFKSVDDVAKTLLMCFPKELQLYEFRRTKKPFTVTEYIEVEGAIKRIATSVREGFTVYYLALEFDTQIYTFARVDNVLDKQLALAKVGDHVSFQYYHTDSALNGLKFENKDFPYKLN